MRIAFSAFCKSIEDRARERVDVAHDLAVVRRALQAHFLEDLDRFGAAPRRVAHRALPCRRSAVRLPWVAASPASQLLCSFIMKEGRFKSQIKKMRCDEVSWMEEL